MSMDKDYLRNMAKEVEKHLPDNHGFILLAFPFEPGGRMIYTSNAERAGALCALKEFLIANKVEEDWMKHVK